MKNFNIDVGYELYGFVGLKLMVDGFGINARDVYLLGFSLYVGGPSKP